MNVVEARVVVDERAHEVVRDAAHGEARQGAYAPRFRCRCSS
jgi:hypothetical protein